MKKGATERVSLKVNNATGDARLALERNSRDSGFQRMSYEISPHGETSKLVQTAFDDEVRLVRQRPGEAKQNLYDVKKWSSQNAY